MALPVLSTSLACERIAWIDATRSTSARRGRPTLLESRELAIAGKPPVAAALQTIASLCGSW